METLYSYLGYYKPDVKSQDYFRAKVLPAVTEESPLPCKRCLPPHRDVPSWALHQYILSHPSPEAAPRPCVKEGQLAEWAIKEFSLAQEVCAEHKLNPVEAPDVSPIREWVADEYEQKKQARYPLIVYLRDLSRVSRKKKSVNKTAQVRNVPKWDKKEYLNLKWRSLSELPGSKSLEEGVKTKQD